MRSLHQNKYYWSVIIETLVNHNNSGYTRNEWHEILKSMFLSEVKMLSTKHGLKEIRIPISTTEISTVGAEDYYSQIRQWASIELSCWIPEPNEEIK